MRELDETLVDAIQWIAQDHLDAIYGQVRELRHIDGSRVEPSAQNVEALIDRCLHNWMKSGDTFD